jgi:hypothetical protein
MRIWKINNDQLQDMGVETNRIGECKDSFSSLFSNLDRNSSFIFPFTTTSHSLGDWGILNKLPECIKKIYPNSEFYLPSPELIREIFLPLFNVGNWSSFIEEPWKVNEIIHSNNPYISGRYNRGELIGECYTDHYRIYSSEDDANEPLIEQVLRAFGVTNEEIQNLDTTPKLYISEQEEEWYGNFIKKYFGKEYGCLLLSQSRAHLNHRWEFDYHLFPHIKKYNDLPVFYYSSFDIGSTDWGDKFSNFISFTDLKLSFREQMIIKQKAIFNIGYQAGITDTISGGGSDIITLTNGNLKHNIVRGAKYVFKDGNFKIF